MNIIANKSDHEKFYKFFNSIITLTLKNWNRFSFLICTQYVKN